MHFYSQKIHGKMKVCGTDGERNFFGFFFTRFLNVLLVFQLYDFFFNVYHEKFLFHSANTSFPQFHFLEASDRMSCLSLQTYSEHLSNKYKCVCICRIPSPSELK